MPTAYSYLRFSSPEQAKGDSFRRQSQMAPDYAERHGLALDETLTFHDLGVSAFRGANAETGRLGEFLQAVQSGLVAQGSVLLVESLDRISRQAARKALRVLENIIDAGVTVVTMSDGRSYDAKSMNDDPVSLFMALLIFVRGNEESAMKARRGKATWEHKRAKMAEKPLTGRVPSWLALVDGAFQVVDERAAVVRRIYAEALAGRGEHSIAAGLNRDSVPMFGRGKLWHRSYVSKLLTSDAASGAFTAHTLAHIGGKKVRARQQTVLSYFPAVIDPETFAAVRAMRASRNPQRGRHAKSEIQYVLAGGLARCSACGSTMTRVMKGKRSKPTLICTKAKTGAGCEYRPIHVETVEAGLIEHLRLPIGEDDIYRVAPKQRQAAQADAEEARLVEQIERLTHIITTKMSSDALLLKLASLEKSLAFWRNGNGRIKARLAQIDHDTAAVRRAEFRKIMSTEPLDRVAANAAARRWLNHVDIDVERGSLRLHTTAGSVEGSGFTLPPSAAQLSRERVKLASRDSRGRILSNEALHQRKVESIGFIANDHGVAFIKSPRRFPTSHGPVEARLHGQERDRDHVSDNDSGRIIEHHPEQHDG